MERTNTLNRHLRWAETNRAVPITVVIAVLVGLGIFAYFASVVDNFPGEVSFSTWVQSWRTPWLDSLMKAVSTLGIAGVASGIVLATAAALYLKGWRAESLLVLAAPPIGQVLTIALKNIIERPRPSDGLVQVLQQADGYAFPSGQVTHYVVFLGTLLFVTWIGMRPSTAVRLFQWSLVLTTAVIGVGRIYLGAHWLGDVVAGYAFGAALAAGLAWSWWRWIGRRRASPALH